MYDQTCQRRLLRNHTGDGRYDTAHKDLRPSETRLSEKDLQTLITAFHNFINPFEVKVKEDLFCISSGARAPDEVAKDILNDEAVGKAF